MKNCITSYLVMIVLISVVCTCKQRDTPELPLSSSYVVEVTGENYHWKVKHPGKDGLLHTDDDISKENDLHIPANSDVQLIFKSNDYLYFVELPEMNKNGMAVPGLESPTLLKTKSPAIIQFRGNQMCGFSHGSLITTLTIESRQDLVQYLLSD